MADKYKIIVMMIIIAAVIVFFMFFYTPAALKKAEKEFNDLKKNLLNKNEILNKEIAAHQAHQMRMEKELAREKEKTARLESELLETKKSLQARLSQISKLQNNEVVSLTRHFLTQYIQKNPFHGKSVLTENDLYQTKTNVNWSFFSMKVNLSVLTEHYDFKTKLIPQLEEKSAGFEKQSEYNRNLYTEEKNISEKRKEQYENEKTLRLKSEDLYASCKKTLKTGKKKSLLMGGGIGAGLVLILSLLK